MSKKKEVTLEEKLKEAIIPKEEQPYEIPDNWKWVKLEGIIEYTTNLDIQKKLDKNETINYVDIESVNNKLFKINTIKEKKVSELSTRARRVLKKGYMMYSLVRPYLNNFALIEEEKENFIGSTGFAVFKSKVSPIKYIFYYMQTNYIKEYYQSFLKGFNSPSITIENFNSTSIPLPPLEEQERIVKKLDSMLGRINEAKELIAQAKETFENRRASILNLAFSGELTRKWRESNSIESSKILLENLNKEKIRLWEEECEKALEEGKKKPLKPKLLSVEEMVIPKEEQPYEIPESWEWVKLERIILNTQYGYTEKSSNIGEIKYLRITDIQNENVNWKSVPFCKITEEDKKKYLLNKNDIVIARTGATTGKSYLITDIKLESVFASYLIRIRPILDIYKYLNKFFKSSLYWNQIIDMSSGIAQPGVNARKLETLNIPLPPIEEQKEIVRILDNVLEKEDKINEILEMEEMIELLEKSILDKAFRGELGTGNLEDVPSLEVLKNILEK